MENNEINPSLGFNRRRMQIVLWIIPVIVWIFLFIVFTLDRNKEMVPLLHSNNTEEISKVENFLEHHGIRYEVREQGTIHVDKADRVELENQLVLMGLVKSNSLLNFVKKNTLNSIQ